VQSVFLKTVHITSINQPIPGKTKQKKVAIARHTVVALIRSSPAARSGKTNQKIRLPAAGWEVPGYVTSSKHTAPNEKHDHG
jgi:hypothetical protein